MPIFTQCVNIVQTELGPQIKSHHDYHKNDPPHPHIIHDTFIKESRELYNTLVVLKQFLSEVRSEYLAINNDGVGPTSNSLSIEDKNKIDEELNYRFQQLYEKLKLLQAYEAKRELVRLKNNASSKGWFDSVFGEGVTDKELYETTVNSHRTQVLVFLNSAISTVSKEFERLQRKRSLREKQLNLLNFQDLQDYDDDDDDIPAVQLRRLSVLEFEHEQNSSTVPLEELDDANHHHDQLQLSSDQIQEFEAENKQFLMLKNNQLQQVERLHSSMVDIMNLQSEITFQLDTQAEKVSTIMETQDDIQVDLTQGNKTLTKASVKNKRGADMLVTFCIIMGVLILVVDYISW